MSSLRALPRFFVAEASADEPIELPPEVLDKVRKVLRLSSGDEIAILPGDGRVFHCRLEGRRAHPLSIHRPDSEPALPITVAQALPKGDKIDEIVRAGTEIGVSSFVFFPSDRTVVRWDAAKTEDRLRRLRTIARESAEVSFRTRVPHISSLASLQEVLCQHPDAAVLSEQEGLSRRLVPGTTDIVVGPEGGWAPREVEWIGDRGVTLGPRVLRVEHAAAAAAAVLLLA